MIAIAVDDELLMLRALVRAISVSPDITGVFKFLDCEDKNFFGNNGKKITLINKECQKNINLTIK